MVFTDTQEEVLTAIALLISAVSLAGSVLIVLSVIIFPRLRTFTFKLIVALAIASAGFNFGYLSTGSDGGVLCWFQGLARVYFALVSFALTTAITLSCYQMVTKKGVSLREKLWEIMVVCWGGPLLITAAPAITGSFSPITEWCEIAPVADSTSNLWRFGIVYLPLWSLLVFNFWMHMSMGRAVSALEAAVADAEGAAHALAPETPERGRGGIREPITPGTPPHVDEATSLVPPSAGSARSESSDTSSAGNFLSSRWRSFMSAGSNRSGSRRTIGGAPSRLQGIIGQLRMYPLALAVCWSWASVNRIYEAIYPDEPLFWLYVLQYSFLCLGGVLYAIIFVITPSVCEEWSGPYRRWELRRRRQRRATSDSDIGTGLGGVASASATPAGAGGRKPE